MGSIVITLGCHSGGLRSFCHHSAIESLNFSSSSKPKKVILIGQKKCLEEITLDSGIVNQRILLSNKSEYFPENSFQSQSYELFQIIQGLENIDEVHFSGYSPISFHLLIALNFGVVKPDFQVVSHNEPPNLDILDSLNSSFFDKAVFQFMWSEIQHTVPKKMSKKLPSAKVSIVIPHFNQGNFLSETINSLSQILNRKGFEIIVVDDGSTDPFAKSIFKKLRTSFESNYSNIKFFETGNQGVGAARNFGAQKSSGDFLFFLDSDNLLMENFSDHIQKSLSAIDHNAIVTFPNVYFEDRIGDYSSLSGTKGFFPIGNVPELSWVDNFLGDSTFLIKKSVFLKLKGFSEERNNTHQDWQFLLKASLLGAEIRPYPIPIYYYRVWSGSMSNYMSDHLGRYRSIELFFEHFGSYKNSPLLVSIFLNISKDLRSGVLQYNGATSPSALLGKIAARYLPQESLRRKLASKALNFLVK
jgi:glycosyltransferase involved in cell wall biosynthesis